MKKSVFFYEVFEEEEISLRKHLPATWKCDFTALSVQDANHTNPPADVISIRTQSIIPAEWSGDLQAILSRSAGYDHLTNFHARTKSTAALGHLYQYSGRAVAEHAVMLGLALFRKLPSQIRSMRTFSRDGLTGRECAGRTLAVFGVGDIGYNVCQIGTGLGMTVLGVDIVQSHPDIKYISHDEALAAADLIVCSMNLTDVNNNYFSGDVLKHCREDAVFVNVARGEFSHNSTLLDMLESGRLSGVGLDVYYDEPHLGSSLREGTFIDHPEFLALQKLLLREDAILTPHNAFNTIEAIDRKSRQTAMQLQHYFDNGTFLSKPLTERA